MCRNAPYREDETKAAVADGRRLSGGRFETRCRGTVVAPGRKPSACRPVWRRLAGSHAEEPGVLRDTPRPRETSTMPRKRPELSPDDAAALLEELRGEWSTKRNRWHPSKTTSSKSLLETLEALRGLYGENPDLRDPYLGDGRAHLRRAAIRDRHVVVEALEALGSWVFFDLDTVSRVGAALDGKLQPHEAIRVLILDRLVDWTLLAQRSQEKVARDESAKKVHALAQALIGGLRHSDWTPWDVQDCFYSTCDSLAVTLAAYLTDTSASRSSRLAKAKDVGERLGLTASDVNECVKRYDKLAAGTGSRRRVLERAISGGATSIAARLTRRAEDSVRSDRSRQLTARKAKSDADSV